VYAWTQTRQQRNTQAKRMNLTKVSELTKPRISNVAVKQNQSISNTIKATSTRPTVIKDAKYSPVAANWSLEDCHAPAVLRKQPEQEFKRRIFFLFLRSTISSDRNQQLLRRGSSNQSQQESSTSMPRVLSVNGWDHYVDIRRWRHQEFNCQ
jgi:hypothetical protein